MFEINERTLEHLTKQWDKFPNVWKKQFSLRWMFFASLVGIPLFAGWAHYYRNDVSEQARRAMQRGWRNPTFQRVLDIDGPPIPPVSKKP